MSRFLRERYLTINCFNMAIVQEHEPDTTLRARESSLYVQSDAGHFDEGR